MQYRVSTQITLKIKDSSLPLHPVPTIPPIVCQHRRQHCGRRLEADETYSTRSRIKLWVVVRNSDIISKKQETYWEEQRYPLIFQSLVDILPSCPRLTCEIRVTLWNKWTLSELQRYTGTTTCTSNRQYLVHARHVNANAATVNLVAKSGLEYPI